MGASQVSPARRRAIHALCALPLGYFLAWNVKAQGRASLTINLDQWKAIEVTHGKDSVVLTPKDIFEALKED